MTAAQTSFRDAMARLGAAVNIVTTAGVAGRHGITASSVCSVTDAPPTLLLCVNRASSVNAVLKGNGVLCVNVLAAHHAALSKRFADGATSVDDRFGDTSGWRVVATGAPALIDASVALDCRIASVSEVGTHSVFFCEVAEVVIADDAAGLIWFDRSYHPVRSQVAA